MNEQDLYMEFEGWEGTYLYVGGGYLYVVDMVEPDYDSFIPEGEDETAILNENGDMPVGEAHVEYISPDYVLHKCGFILYWPRETLRDWCEKNKLPIPWERVSNSKWDELLNYVS